ncbi:GAF and ANTAR domain-containing protein [Arthrobacter sp. ISL-65]|uniref:GAF and ANTAR domain-containing protein n=1 Tax=Arthrobacter sp. ISL-65 TaxID=2819112 RepID=UPI001BE93DE2|nr:GAF and ANTAR domain-containing protein [Arthrobacter sp. ISL-65]MBT2549705.1 GAF and ANTAR domain-containing protein [Arthrobacter sp. ISL-65]
MGVEARAWDREDVAGRLQELVLESVDVGDFLQELAGYSAAFYSAPGMKVRCAFTVLRRKKAATVASSDPQARMLDEVQVDFGEGPCLAAMAEMCIVHVPDVESEPRWPAYMSAVAGRGVGSILAVPLALEGETRAALNLFSARSHGFTGEDISGAEEFAAQASKSLRLALRMAQLTDSRNDLAAAMQSRTAIDIATGIIMAQNRCSQEAALRVLKTASSLRNLKLRDVAVSVAASVGGDSALSTHFDE